MEAELTKGKTFKTLFLFAIPMILSVTLQQFYNICDSMIAGKMVGNDALASVSASYPLTMIYLAIGTGFGVGTNIVVSRLMGENRQYDAKTSIYTSIITIAIIGLIVTIFGVIFVDQLLIVINVESRYFDDAKTYLLFYTLGIIFLFVYNSITSSFQAVGNSKIPLYFLIFSTILNIILDIWFVTAFQMGVAGLAFATFLSQVIATIGSFFCLIIYVNKKVSKNKKYFDKYLLKDIFVIGLPSILQSSTVSFGQLLIQSLINKQGGDVVAGYGAAYKLTYVVINIFATISNALSTFVSQNAGAKKYTRINEGFISCLLICGIFSIITIILFIILKEPLLSIFSKEGESLDATKVGCLFIQTITPYIWLMAIKIPSDGVLKGSKDMFSFVLGTMLDLIARVAFSYILFENYGIKGIFISWPIGWLIGTAVSITCYFIGRWKKLINYKIIIN